MNRGLSGLCLAGVITAGMTPAIAGDVRWSAEAYALVDEARARTLFNPDGGLLDAGREVGGVAAQAVGAWQGSAWSARIDARTEARHASSGQDEIRGTLSEAALDWAPREGHVLSGGLGHFRWGTAYIWNPSNPLADDEFNNESRARSYYRDGDRYVSYEALAGKTTYTVAAVELTQRDALLANPPRDERWAALRIQRVFDASDASLHVAVREGERFLGASASWTTGQALELHGELGLRSQRRFPGWRGVTVGSPSAPPLPVWDEAARRHWTASAVLGGQYTFEGGANLIIEYLHDGNGLDDGEYDALRAAAGDVGVLRDDPALAAAADGFLLQANRYTGRMRRDYAFVRLAQDGLIAHTDAQAYTRLGLNDDAWIVGWLLRWQIGERRSLALSGEHLRGSDTGEAGLVPVRNRYQLSFKHEF